MFQTWQSYACECRPDRGSRITIPTKRSAIAPHIVGSVVSHLEVQSGHVRPHDQGNHHDHSNHLPSSVMYQFDFEGNLSFVATTNDSRTSPHHRDRRIGLDYRSARLCPIHIITPFPLKGIARPMNRTLRQSNTIW